MADDIAAAYEDGVGRLRVAVEAALARDLDWDSRLAAGLRAALDLLDADPALARLLLVESLTAGGSARRERERALERLAEVLRPPPGLPPGAYSQETARLLAGGLVSYLSGRLLRGEAGRLAESYDLLLGYLLVPLRGRPAPRG